MPSASWDRGGDPRLSETSFGGDAAEAPDDRHRRAIPRRAGRRALSILRYSCISTAVAFSILAGALAACGSSEPGTHVASAAGPRSDASIAGIGSSAPVEPKPEDGAARTAVESPPLAPPATPSLTAVAGYEKIVQKPDTKAPLIGLIRAGQSVPLAEPAALTKGPGGSALAPCKGGWYAVKPRGYVCLGAASSLDANDPRAVAAREVLPDATLPLPFHVGVAIGSPEYLRIPTREEQAKSEKGLDEYLKKIPAPDAVGAIDTKPAGHGPSKAFSRYLETAKPGLVGDDEAYAGRRIAWAREFDAEGRTWLVTPDLTLIPKDKVRVATGSSLHGIDLKKEPEMHLPLGFTWIGDVAKLKKTSSGDFVETGESYPRHAFVGVEPELVRGPKGMYWQTRDGYFVRNDQVTVLKKRDDRPKGVSKSDPWVDVRVTWGTLVAYEGDTPVFATAISPGQDGITQRAQGHTSKMGVYQIGWKLYSANMAGVEKKQPWAVDEVPFVAYYKDSFGLHGAWWHDDFGRPKSHGCINMAPADAQWMWRWFHPEMPEGWYAVAGYYPDVKGTTVEIRP